MQSHRDIQIRDRANNAMTTQFNMKKQGVLGNIYLKGKSGKENTSKDPALKNKDSQKAMPIEKRQRQKASPQFGNNQVVKSKKSLRKAIRPRVDEKAQKSIFGGKDLKLTEQEKESIARLQKLVSVSQIPSIIPMEGDICSYLNIAQNDFKLDKKAYKEIVLPRLERSLKVIRKLFRELNVKESTFVLAIHNLMKIGATLNKPEEVDNFIIPAFMIACKIEEYYPPGIGEIICCVDSRSKEKRMKFRGELDQSQALEKKSFYQNLQKQKSYLIIQEGKALEILGFRIFVPPVLDYLNLINHYLLTPSTVKEDSKNFLFSALMYSGFYFFDCCKVAQTCIIKAYKLRRLKLVHNEKLESLGISELDASDFERISSTLNISVNVM